MDSLDEIMLILNDLEKRSGVVLWTENKTYDSYSSFFQGSGRPSLFIFSFILETSFSISDKTQKQIQI